MQIRVETALGGGDLLCLRTAGDGSQLLGRWKLGDEAIGVAARNLNQGAMAEYTPGKSSADVLVKGSHIPGAGQIVLVKTATNIREKDLVCLRHLDGGGVALDIWQFGDEAVGTAARNLTKGEEVKFCPDASTDDIQVRPTRV